MRNTTLKAAIFEAGTTQRGLARATKIPESYLSQAINGRYNLNEQQRKCIAIALGRPEQELFQ